LLKYFLSYFLIQSINLSKKSKMFNKKYPFLTLSSSVALLRIVVAAMFIIHATVRIYANTINQFGDFLETKGFPIGSTIVWLITIFEIVGGLILMLGYFKKWIALGFIILLGVGIIIIHTSQGWFNGEFGTGGCEYSVTLIAALIVIASSGK
jgi:putative oxidoreductase